jgi:hypothetical protein
MRIFRRKAETKEVADAALLEEVDEQLRQALSIQPSAGFASKVRARIGEQRRRHERWGWRWAAAVAGILAVAIVWRTANIVDEESPATPERRPSSADVRLAAVPAPTGSTEPPVQIVPAIRQRPTTVRTTRKPDGTSPEIIVPEDNARAVARLLSLARSGGIDEEKLTPIVAPVSSPTLDIPPLGVAAITVPDIEIANGPSNSADRQE